MRRSELRLLENQVNSESYSEREEPAADFRELSQLHIINLSGANKGNHYLDGVCISDLN